MNFDEGGGPVEQTAPYTFGDAEPTVHEFVPGKPEQATRFTYIADASQVGYSLVVAAEALKFPDLIATVAGQWAATWDINADVPGVEDIAETQTVKPLGSLQDVVQVMVSSTSGKSESVITLTQRQLSPDVFAKAITARRTLLDSFEKTPA